MKLFEISKNDVIRTQNALWDWNEEEERFVMDDDTNPYDKSSINAIYINGDYNNKRAISAGDLIEVKDSETCAGDIFTIIDIDIVDVMELFDVAHKASLGLSYRLTAIDGDRYYQPYKVCDLTNISKRKERSYHERY